MKKPPKDIQMLGPHMTLEGSLVFEGTMIMNGHVKGSIESKEGTIVIGEQAVIHADIFVHKASVSGEIRGTVKATDSIELHPPARVYGDLSAPVVIIDAGVTFDGKCTTEKKDQPPNEMNEAIKNLPGKKGNFMKSLERLRGSTGLSPVGEEENEPIS